MWPFLPQKLGGAQEKDGPLFPAHHVGPLVDQQRQVAPGLDPLRVEVAEDRLAGRADGQALLQLLAAGVGDPGDFGREPLDVLGLACQKALGHEQREIGVLVPGGFEARVEAGLHVFPQAEAVRADDHRAADGLEVVGQLRAADGGDVPPRERLGVAGVLGRQLSAQLDLWRSHRVSVNYGRSAAAIRL